MTLRMVPAYPNKFEKKIACIWRTRGVSHLRSFHFPAAAVYTWPSSNQYRFTELALKYPVSYEILPHKPPLTSFTSSFSIKYTRRAERGPVLYGFPRARARAAVRGPSFAPRRQALGVAPFCRCNHGVFNNNCGRQVGVGGREEPKDR